MQDYAEIPNTIKKNLVTRIKIISGMNITEKYKKGLLIFKELITEANLAKWYPYPIQIAHGFSICEEFTREKIDEAIAIADSEMYHNKQEIKNNK